MSLPVLKRCCGCLSIEAGCIILTIASAMLCIAMISVGSWLLPQHKQRRNEDNLLLMSMVMFSTLSAISNLMVLLGILRNRPGYLQLSLLSNSVFLLCLLMVSLVTCIFSPALRPFLEQPENVVLVVALILLYTGYSVYYLIIVNSRYAKIKITYSDSAIPL